MAAQNELLAEAILEDKLVVLMLFQQLVYKPVENISCRQVVGTALSQLVNKLATSPLRTYLLLTSCWNSIITTSMSSKIASASNSFWAAILDVYLRILRMRC
jgi:hypothetical protein